MKITDVEIKNFRALKDVSFKLDDKQSIFVGRNNSGKTSAMDLFNKFINRPGKNTFSWNDFSIICVNKFIDSINEYKKSTNPGAESDNYEKTQKKFPKISLKLKIEYGSDENITNLSPFIMDLDSNKNYAHILFEFSHNNIHKLLQSITSINGDDKIITYLRKHYDKECSIKVFPYYEEESIVGEEVTATEVSNLFTFEIIGANRAIEYEENRKKGNLALEFEKLYGVIDNEKGDKTTNLQGLLDEFSQKFNKGLLKIMAPYLEEIKKIGYFNQPKLEIKLVLTALNFLRSSMEIWFSDMENTKAGYELPESHSGLGYKNLFYILARIFYFIEQCRTIDIPNIKLLVIEEPECHVHPQIQISFIKKCQATINNGLGAENMFQIVITTHSSHIVSNAEFSQLLYFIAGSFKSDVKHLKKLEKDKESINFIKTNLNVSNCDIFFADKIVIVEGISEELVLRKKIIEDKKIDQDISFINAQGVGNINKFIDLIDFIEIKTLIVTDLDLGENKRNNQVIKKWFEDDYKIDKILDKTLKDKTKNKIMLAYQTPEIDLEGKSGDDFEEANILKNPKLSLKFIQKRFNYSQDYCFNQIIKPEDILNGHYGDKKIPNWQAIAKSIKGKNKVEFARYIIKDIKNWKVPRYIEEGINWLAKR